MVAYYCCHKFIPVLVHPEIVWLQLEGSGHKDGTMPQQLYVKALTTGALHLRYVWGLRPGYGLDLKPVFGTDDAHPLSIYIRHTSLFNTSR